MWGWRVWASLFLSGNVRASFLFFFPFRSPDRDFLS